MKSNKRKERLAALLGLEIKKPPTKEEIEAAGTISREADAVILFALDPKKFVQRECDNCGLVFAVSRTSIAVCSDTCRKHYLWNKYKIEWDPNARTLEDRWSASTGGPEPLIVPPLVLPMILDALDNQPVPQQPEQSLDELLDLSAFDL